jgi:hypothetical protein
MKKKRQRYIGNCPQCGFDCNSGSKYTPRHLHIKIGKRWLPPCIGSGKLLDNLQKIVQKYERELEGE